MEPVSRNLDAAGIIRWRTSFEEQPENEGDNDYDNGNDDDNCNQADTKVTPVIWLASGDGLDLPSPTELLHLVSSQRQRVRLLRLSDHILRFDGPLCARAFTTAAASGALSLAALLFDAWLAGTILRPRLEARARRSILIQQRCARRALLLSRRWPSGTLHLHDMPAGIALLAVRSHRHLWPANPLIIRTAGDRVQSGPLWWSMDLTGRATFLN